MTSKAPEAAAGASASSGAEALEGGSYEVIRRRLLEHAETLGKKAETLNERRKQAFGGTELQLVATERIRTEHNCVPRDIVSIRGRLLVGYLVVLGLKQDAQVSDVFALHRFTQTAEGHDFAPVPLEEGEAFLADPAFVKDFKDLFRYTKETRLLQLRRTETRLLAIFQTGSTERDVKVFRWSVDGSGRIKYMDGRGENDNLRPRSHDFEWKATTREDQVAGKHPHVSILDEIFVETVGGDLTVKVENNTASGLGIYSEPVEDANQGLDDAEIRYAKLGTLILLKIKPFREQDYRYLVYNSRLKKVTRLDAIGQACLTLPEDQGIVFPNGYYLLTGESKKFEERADDLLFERVIRSPNGEDVLYVFHRLSDGRYLLFPYNVIRKEIATPIPCHGYSLFDDGKMVIFRATGDEATRVHPMQIWQTPFTTAEYAASVPTDGSYLAKVGNPDLVRGISEALSLRRLCVGEQPTRLTFEDVIKTCDRMVDAYYWLGHEEAGDLSTVVRELRKVAESIIDEFEKVEAIRARAAQALAEADETQRRVLSGLRPDDLQSVDAFMRALTELRKQRGHLITMRELKYMDLPRVDALEAEVVARFDEVSAAAAAFLLGDAAFKPLTDRLGALVDQIEGVKKSSELQPFKADLDGVNDGLSLLSEIVAGLKVDDPTARTRILEGVSEVYAQLNRARAILNARTRDLRGAEGRAEFGAQFKLFGQSVASAAAACDTPERCDTELSKLLVQLEELEGRFGEFDEFLSELAAKREEVNEAIGARRQQLVDERQRRVQNLVGAADRILQGVVRRARSFANADELNAYFATDPMVAKVRDLAGELSKLGDSVKSDEVESRLKSARQDAHRLLRDREDLFEEGTSVIRLGRHKFNVNTQPLELTLVPQHGALSLHLTGTDFFETIDDPALNAARELWDQQLVSETAEVYRGELLALSMLEDAEAGRAGLSIAGLRDAALSVVSDAGPTGRMAQGPNEGLLAVVRTFSAERHDEGYERGVHDGDTALILEKLLALRSTAGLLRYSSGARALGCLCWASMAPAAREVLHRRARSLGRLRAQLLEVAVKLEAKATVAEDPEASKPQAKPSGSSGSALDALASEVEQAVEAAAKAHGIEPGKGEVRLSARYLVEELCADHPRFVTSTGAFELRDALLAHLDLEGGRGALEEDLRQLEPQPAAQLALAQAWLEAFVSRDAQRSHLGYLVREAAVVLVTERRLDREPSAAVVEARVEGLLGQHPRIRERALTLRLDEFLARVGEMMRERMPRYRAYRKLRSEIVEREKQRLRLDEFSPRVLTSFVRNRLIDEVYLPLIGANLAKQLGSAGEGKRTDLMGMLLLISPPGYGKTTLMEYVASKLGLVFMKVNGPSLGHDVTSIDPSEAPNATARQEVEKINLALEMGNNVMLYLDDIQHTHPELLQKFISLCDAQRRIEGVWRGRTRTYDLRGKKFCVVMAGNPYTESGARFQIPDMLSNRADTYNLGDILDGKESIFALSYLENALTSNPTLAPLAGREPADVHRFVKLAQGEEVASTDFSYAYSAAEVTEIVEVLKRLFRVQKVLLAVNQEYIRSASQEDAFRTEPPFKLQGSYRNMNKLTEKVVSAHTDAEIDRLVDDHYTSESQTLTSGAEQNLLKLAEMRGRLSAEQEARWDEIKRGFQRIKRMGGKDDDPVVRVTGTLTMLAEQLEGIRGAIGGAVTASQDGAKERDLKSWLSPELQRLSAAMRSLAQPKVEVQVETDTSVSEVVSQYLSIVEQTVAPLAKSATQSAFGVRAVEQHLSEVEALVRSLDEKLKEALTRGRPSGPPAPRFEAKLGGNSPANFYQAGPEQDVVEQGGIFVPTHRTPARGATVSVRIPFPEGRTIEVMGVVEWARPAGGEGPPGFGARFVKLTPEERALIQAYAQARAPFRYDA
ncbi:DNA repair ATPase [Chondromyces crocatus]|uniref:DNA repair ATPase n=1 Tax=Chondromyces crocatus TaxID=52 RepID=A0A0K1EEB1_CHOCO|nr:DNA repair ATPase [Chondromyces crocatus]AKT39027.1 DNA repair ATPase [Chondromyces crocatus]